MKVVELASHAVALNLAGILSMDAKDYGRAIESFSKGLGALKRVLQEEEEGPAQQRPPSPPISEALLEDCFAFSETAGPGSAARGEGGGGGGGFVFRCPIAATSSRLALRCRRFHVMLSFALLYNLGLAHHLGATDREGPAAGGAAAELRKALALYELAFSVHVSEEVNLSVLQAMVIANNLGQVYASLGASDKAGQCSSHLMSLVLYSIGLCERDRPESLDEFVGNVMHLLLENRGANAPAA